MSKDRFFVLDAGDSRPARVPLPPRASVKASAEDTQGRFSLLELRGGGDVPPHAHDDYDEFVYVIAGELGVDVGGESRRLTAGMCVLLPRGVTRAMRDLGGDASPVHALRVSAPGGREGHLEDATGADPRDDWGDPDRCFVLKPGEARPGRVPVPPAFSVKARTADTGGLFSLLEVTVAQPVPRHTHLVADECVYVLDGELEIEFDGAVHTAGAGQFVLLPHGVPHAIRPGPTPPPRVVQISSPGGWESVVEALIEHRSEVSRAGRFDPAALNRHTRKHHVVYEES
ncbi:cupin domain-containing protein [Nonomuraea sp. NPDC023979]|uniref:cupin domain-containing protein n=1 Tax=Nonomuraea sp. NPDC023979 TaxID=3154796 RepID=UPI0033F81798